MLNLLFGLLGYSILLLVVLYLPLKITKRNKLQIVTMSFFISLIGIFSQQVMSSILSWTVVALLSLLFGYLLTKRMNFESEDVGTGSEKEVKYSSPEKIDKKMLRNIREDKIIPSNQIEETSNKNALEEDIEFLNNRIFTKKSSVNEDLESSRKKASSKPFDENLDTDFETILSHRSLSKGEL